MKTSMMNKVIAGAACVSMMAVGAAAMAETVTVSSFTLTLPDGFTEYGGDHDHDDLGEWSNGSMKVEASLVEADDDEYGLTGTALENAVVRDEDDITDHGVTTINGVECVYYTEQDDDDHTYEAHYYIPSTNTTVEVAFSYNDATDANTVADIMNTLAQ